MQTPMIHSVRAPQPRDSLPWPRQYHGDPDTLGAPPGAFHTPIIESDGEKITAIYIVRNPEKLRLLPVGDYSGS